MTEASARFGLPFILPGQAQKEFHHNEALALLDAALHAAVEEGPIADAARLSGGGTKLDRRRFRDRGVGRAGRQKSPTWTDAGWRFVAPVPGMLVWNIDAGYWLSWSGSAWRDGELPAAALHIGGQQVVGPRLPGVPSPSGGTIIDAEARAAIDALIAALRSHGLID